MRRQTYSTADEQALGLAHHYLLAARVALTASGRFPALRKKIASALKSAEGADRNLQRFREAKPTVQAAMKKAIGRSCY